MKNISLLTFLIIMTLISCKQNNKTNKAAEYKEEIVRFSSNTSDIEEILKLLKEVLAWSDSLSNSDLLPMVSNGNNQLVIGIDLKKHQANLEELKQTQFFNVEFIENFNQIVLSIDKRLRNKELGDWYADEMPPFQFLNGINPWCMCQDNLPWDQVEIDIVKISSEQGDLTWNWGNIDSNYDSSWKEFKYSFKVKRVNEKWLISYLQGFDFNNLTKQNL